MFLGKNVRVVSILLGLAFGYAITSPFYFYLEDWWMLIMVSLSPPEDLAVVLLSFWAELPKTVTIGVLVVGISLAMENTKILFASIICCITAIVISGAILVSPNELFETSLGIVLNTLVITFLVSTAHFYKVLKNDGRKT
tara:strand:+ start:487 stop:906 length:420 start_codon:yes stop_codon:yes gene_type:complete